MEDVRRPTTDELRPNVTGRIAVGDMVRRARNRFPERTAFVVPETGESLTFEEFDRRTNRVAHAFTRAGLRAGDRVATICDNSLQFVTAFFGTVKAGMVFVPISPEMTTEGLQYELAHSDADALLVDDERFEEVESECGIGALDPLLSVDVADVETPVPTFRSFIDDEPTTQPDVEIEGSDLALIMYTSGTTSQPKGVMLSHRALFTAANNWTSSYGLSCDDVVGCMMPLFHSAQHSCTLSAVHASATSVIQRGFDPATIADAIEAHGITVVIGIPMMYRQLLALDDIESRDVSSLSRCVYGMPMQTSTLERGLDVFDAEFPLLYGMTEVYPPATRWIDTEEQLAKTGNYVGRSADNTDVAIVDDQEESLPRGELGEIVFRGPNVMNGYLDDEAKTAEAFSDGWLHSGDLGYFDEDGCLKFVDRKKHVIKTGGENVSTQKVENVVRDHPDVEEAAVVGLPHSRWTEAVTAFVVPAEGSNTSVDAIEAHCADRLAGFERPKAVILIDELPKSVSGKAQKHELAEEYEGYYAG